MDQTKPPSTPPTGEVSTMARLAFHSSAKWRHRCEEDPFVKGYITGFEAGWAKGYKQAYEEGIKKGRLEAEAAAAAKGSSAANEVDVPSNPPSDGFSHLRKNRPLDASSPHLPSPAEPTRHLGQGLDQIKLGTSTWNAPSGKGKGRMNDAIPRSLSKDTIDLLDDLCLDDTEQQADLISFNQHNSGRSPTVAGPSNKIISSRKLTDPFFDGSLSIPKASNMGGTPALQITTPALFTGTPSTINSPATTPTRGPRHSRAEQKTADKTSGIERTTTTTTKPTTTTSTIPIQPDTLYNIPLAHTVRPIVPDLDISPWERRTRPAYPELATEHFNTNRQRAPGSVRVTANPWRVLIGPLGEAARAAWSGGDMGKAYLRNKLGGAEKAGLAFCEMLRDEAGASYVLGTFTSPKKARRALEVFERGYPCGGSIMWGWIYLEEE